MPIYPELRGRVAVVTGAANGIGATTTRAFAAQGSRVALLDLDLKGAQALAAELEAETLCLGTDVTDRASVEGAVAAVLERFGRIDVLVNCAGGYHAVRGVEETDEPEWDRTISLNLKSVYLVSRAVLPTMKAQRAGRIVTVASGAGRAVFGNTTSVSYGVAKAGVIQLTRFLAQELGPYGITANSIAPGTTLTPRVAAFRTEDEVARISTQVPLRRMAMPDDHAETILWLASDAAGFVNGVTVDVNGGRVMQ